MHKRIPLTVKIWLRSTAPVGLALLIPTMLFISLACKISTIETLMTPITNSTPTMAPIGEMSKPWSAAPTPLPEIKFPPPVEDQAILDQAEKSYQQGLEAYNAKDWQAALNSLNTAIQLNPRHASAYTYRGRTYLMWGNQNDLSIYLVNHDLAVMDFSRAIALDPSQWYPYYGRGYCYHDRAQVEPLREYRNLWRELALNDLDHAVELDEWQGWARGERVAIYIETNQCDTALHELLSPYLSDIPLTDQILYMLKTDRCLKDYTEGMRLVNEQLARGETADLYWQRGLIYAGQKDYEKALADLDTAARLWPGDFAPGTLWYNRASIEYYRGNYALVKENIHRGRRYTWIDWGSPYYFLGKVFLSEGDNEQAIAAFVWAEKTVEEGDFLNATRDELSKLGALPAYVPTLTSTPKAVATPTFINGNTPIPTEMAGQIGQAYGVMVLIQIHATVLNEAATRAQVAELDEVQKKGAFRIMDSMVGDIDRMIPTSVTPEALSLNWEQALAVHAKTKDFLTQWKNLEITPQQVTAIMAPLLSELEAVIQDTQKVMSNEWGFDINELIQQQQDLLANVDRMFGSTVTPTPTFPTPTIAPATRSQ